MESVKNPISDTFKSQRDMPPQVTAWKTELLENAAGIFGGDVLAADGKERIRELQAKIGELTMENDFSYGPLLVNKQIDAHRGTTIWIF